jgi:hypothetical protein
VPRHCEHSTDRRSKASRRRRQLSQGRPTSHRSVSSQRMARPARIELRPFRIVGNSVGARARRRRLWIARRCAIFTSIRRRSHVTTDEQHTVRTTAIGAACLSRPGR